MDGQAANEQPEITAVVTGQFLSLEVASEISNSQD